MYKTEIPTSWHSLTILIRFGLQESARTGVFQPQRAENGPAQTAGLPLSIACGVCIYRWGL